MSSLEAFILILLMLFIAFDSALFLVHGIKASFTYNFFRIAKDYPIFILIFGILIGHFLSID